MALFRLLGAVLLAGSAAPESFPGWLQGREAQLAFFRSAYLEQERLSAEGLGEFFIEAEAFFHALRRSFVRRRRDAIFLDVGCNTGNALAAMMTTFAGLSREPLTLWGFEPNPETFAALEQGLRLPGGLAEKHRVELRQVAVSDRRGSAAFYHRGRGDLLAGLSRHPDRHLMPYGRSEDSETVVNVVTLDEVFPRGAHVHLLKVDAEGQDPLVLRGASRLLRQRRVKFVVFEYDVAWQSNGHNLTLRDVAEEMAAKGYSCFLMSKAVLLPLYGVWWQSAYNSLAWGNVFCGQEQDHDLFDAYLAHGPSNNFTLAFALTSLQAAAPLAHRS